MYSILISKIDKSFDLYKEFLKKKVKNKSKVVILPWAFPVEIDGNRLINSFNTWD